MYLFTHFIKWLTNILATSPNLIGQGSSNCQHTRRALYNTSHPRECLLLRRRFVLWFLCFMGCYPRTYEMFKAYPGNVLWTKMKELALFFKWGMYPWQKFHGGVISDGIELRGRVQLIERMCRGSAKNDNPLFLFDESSALSYSCLSQSFSLIQYI